MEGMDCSAVRCFETDGDTVADRGRVAVGWIEYKERRFIDTPNGAGFVEIGHALQADFFQGCVIERTCFGQVVGANAYMGKNGHLGFLSVVVIGMSSGAAIRRFQK
ncbi:hypothetical protein D3C75_1110710 [compost metagenome]